MVKQHTSHTNFSICSGAVIQLKPKAEYFKLPLSDTNKKWQNNWFYCYDFMTYMSHQGLPPYAAGAPAWRKTWSVKPAKAELHDVRLPQAEVK